MVSVLIAQFLSIVACSGLLLWKNLTLLIENADGIFSLEFKRANKSQRLIGTEKDSKLVKKKSR